MSPFLPIIEWEFVQLSTLVKMGTYDWLSIIKNEIDKSVDLSLCGLAPAQSQMDSFLYKLFVRNKQRAVNFNQSEEAMLRVRVSAIFFRDMTTDFRRNRYSKNRLICECAGELTHAIAELSSNSLTLTHFAFTCHTTETVTDSISSLLY